MSIVLVIAGCSSDGDDNATPSGGGVSSTLTEDVPCYLSMNFDGVTITTENYIVPGCGSFSSIDSHCAGGGINTIG